VSLRRGRGLLASLLVLIPAGACAPRATLLEPSGTSTLITATTPDRSMIFLHRTEEGFIVVDLGWLDAEDTLEAQLRGAGAGPEDVAAVFLTHSHRDHIGGWRLVRHAPFHMALPEVDRFLGREEHEGWIPRTADRMLGPAGPGEGEVEIRPFSGDTTFVFGADTIYAFLIPGHTPGSTAYLVDGLLLAGDGIYRSYVGDFREAMAGYSDDTAEALRSLESLFQRLEPHRVENLCTAHGRCAPYTPEFRERLLGRERDRS